MITSSMLTKVIQDLITVYGFLASEVAYSLCLNISPFPRSRNAGCGHLTA